MTPDENKAFVDCMDLFTKHQYRDCHEAALQLVQRRMFRWLVQILLISLERDGRFDVLEEFRNVARKSFAHDEWSSRLFSLSFKELPYEEAKAFATDDSEKLCQAHFYQGHVLLTEGKREAADTCFRECVSTKVECAETHMVAEELSSPEPINQTLERVIASFSGAVKDDDETRIRSILNTLRELFESAAVEEIPHLSRLLAIVEAIADEGGVGDDATASIRQNLDTRFGNAHEALVNGFVVTSMGEQVRTAISAPLTSLRSHLKQIDSSALNPLQLAALTFGFPMFLGRPLKSPNNPIWDELIADGIKPDGEVGPYCRRRYSGEGSQDFPRARYHALCSDESGNDNRTLLQELNAYTVPQLTGHCVAVAGERPDTVNLLFRGLPEEPNPLYLAILEPQRFNNYLSNLPHNGEALKTALTAPSVRERVDARQEFVVPIQCSINEVEMTDCLDLRLPEARTWALSFFQTPPTGLMGEAYVGLAAVHDVDFREFKSWRDILNIILAKSFGGNSLTDVLGTMLRNIGCNGLVFPSARSDHLAHIENGVLSEFYGWNLVDYRGLTPTGKVGLEFGNKIEELRGRYFVADVKDGDQAGSLQVLGSTLYERVINQQTFHERAVLDASEWRLKHKRSEVYLRGFLWYERKYSLGERDFEARCPECKTNFADDAIEIEPVCPSCGYPGDV